MRSTHHRIFSIVLAVLLAAALLCAPAAAAQSGSCGQGLQWQLSGGVLRITGTGALPSYTDDNMPPWYGSAGSITTVIVGSGVTAIGDLAFYGCTALTGVRLPDTLVSVGAAAFKDCWALSGISLPETLQYIGEAAFENCTELSGLILPSSLLSIGDFAFYRCEGLTSIVIPASVQHLGVVAFAYCTGLIRAEVRSQLATLPDWTFYGCTALAEVALPQTVTRTGDYAFRNCENLQTIYYDGTADVIPSKTEGAVTPPTPAGEEPPAQENPSGETAGTPQIRPGEEMPASGSKSDLYTVKNTGETITVTDTGNSSITEKTTTEIDAKINGKDSSLKEALGAGAEDDVSIDSNKTTVISGTVNNSEGWNELEEKIDKALKDSDTVKVDVRLKGSTVSGEDLSKLAEKDIEATISTAGGSKWQIDGGNTKKKSFSQKQYDLEYTVSEVDGKNKPDIKSDTIYKIDFAGSTDFDATVGIRVPNAGRQYATLYQDNEVIQTTIVDNDGIAWFSLANVDSKTKYYLGINASDADLNEAIIPDTLAQEYGAEYTLTDASGKQYQVTGRSSRWGITGSRFAIYVAVAIGGVVLIVTLIMVTINRFAKTKAHYAAKAAADDDAIDEDALRMQIMQEMLDEAQKRKKK